MLDSYLGTTYWISLVYLRLLNIGGVSSNEFSNSGLSPVSVKRLGRLLWFEGFDV